MDTSKIKTIQTLGFPWKTEDPYLFCAHHRDEYPRGNKNQGLNADKLKGRNIGQDFTIRDGYRMYHGTNIPGFPYHPHRGFETITINKEGFVDHTDSLGAAGRFGAGDVQWMTAGKGVQHSEMFPLIHEDKENPLEIFQIWLNLPQKSKFTEPHFKMLWKDMIPIVTEEDSEGRETIIDVIAGAFNGAEAPQPTPESWAADPEHGIMILTIKMEANSEWELPASNNNLVNRTLYFYRGKSMRMGSQPIEVNHSVTLNPTENIHIKNGDKEAYLLLLQGQPINEPVAQHGPFVMNTQKEIQEAFAEFRRTQFGGWPWPLREQVHERSKRRFALYADGREEEK